MEKLIVKKYYTTGDLCRFCEVDVNTIKRWIRLGKLKAILLPSGHYRITRKSAIEFLNDYGFLHNTNKRVE